MRPPAAIPERMPSRYRMGITVTVYLTGPIRDYRRAPDRTAFRNLVNCHRNPILD